MNQITNAITGNMTYSVKNQLSLSLMDSSSSLSVIGVVGCGDSRFGGSGTPALILSSIPIIEPFNQLNRMSRCVLRRQ